jgi:hypothetical protein
MNTHIHTYALTHTYRNVCTNRPRIFTHAYTVLTSRCILHTYIHAYMHTHTHTHTHTQAKDPHSNIHWMNETSHLENQKELRVRDPMYGKIDIVCPPFRPVATACWLRWCACGCVDLDVWGVDLDVWSVDLDVWGVDLDRRWLRCVKCGLRCVKCGLRCVKCGLRCVKCWLRCVTCENVDLDDAHVKSLWLERARVQQAWHEHGFGQRFRTIFIHPKGRSCFGFFF